MFLQLTIFLLFNVGIESNLQPDILPSCTFSCIYCSYLNVLLHIRTTKNEHVNINFFLVNPFCIMCLAPCTPKLVKLHIARHHGGKKCHDLVLSHLGPPHSPLLQLIFNVHIHNCCVSFLVPDSYSCNHPKLSGGLGGPIIYSLLHVIIIPENMED